MSHGVFARFPDLRIASIEAGGEWIRSFVNHLGDTYKKMPNAFDGDPVAQFKHNVYVSPFHEDDLGEIIDVIGADHVLFGSDWPHPEGLAEPCSYVDHLPEGLVRRGRPENHGRQPGPDHAGRAGRCCSLIRRHRVAPRRLVRKVRRAVSNSRVTR